MVISKVWNKMRNKLVLLAAACLALTGCGTESPEAAKTPSPTVSASAPTPLETGTPGSEESSDPTDTASVEEDATAVDVRIQGDKITPNAQRIDLKVGEPIVLNVVSDRAGELHVHSRPEQTPAFGEGRTRIELTVESPGLVDVEEHESGIVILQLEVR